MIVSMEVSEMKKEQCIQQRIQIRYSRVRQYCIFSLGGFIMFAIAQLSFTFFQVLWIELIVVIYLVSLNLINLGFKKNKFLNIHLLKQGECILNDHYYVVGHHHYLTYYWIVLQLIDQKTAQVRYLRLWYDQFLSPHDRSCFVRWVKLL